MRRGTEMDILELVRDTMKDAKPYVAGGKPMPDHVEGYEIAKLNANENMLGPSPKAIEAMAQELAKGYLYPAPEMNKTKDAIGAWLGFSRDNINITAGSASLIAACGESFLNPGDEVVMSSPTYVVYYSMPARFGAKLVEVKNENFAFNVKAALEAITEKTKMVIIVNPNNPTGGMISPEDMQYYFDHVPEHVITIIDEAYIEWVQGKNGYTDALKYVHEGRNVIVLRTFSKIFGMAGIRIGYALSKPDIRNRLSIIEGNYSVSRIALVGARAAITDTEYLEKSLKNNTEGREYLIKEMRALGFDVAESYTSFIYFDCHRDGDVVQKHLESRGLFIRPFAPYLRVTVGLPEQNKRFIEALKEIF